MIDWPVLSSRLPVGSSATRIAGSGDDGAGDRHALLLAARELGGIMVQPVAEADRLQLRLGALEGVAAARRVRAAAATFSSAVMVGTRWKDWNTMPMRRPRNRASASSSRAARSVPVDDDPAAESGRSRPAMVISSVDLPEPEGPTRPTASPRRDVEARCP